MTVQNQAKEEMERMTLCNDGEEDEESLKNIICKGTKETLRKCQCKITICSMRGKMHVKVSIVRIEM